MNKILSTIELLCYQTPHIVEQILSFCPPGSFDSARYSCKAFYSASFSRVLLKQQLVTLLGTVPYEWNGLEWFCPNKSLLDSINDNKFDVARLHEIFSEEISTREGIWRVPSRKIVIQIGQLCASESDEFTQQNAPNVFDTHVIFGTTRGEYMAIVWNDRWKGLDTSMAVYRFFQSPMVPVLSIELPYETKDYKIVPLSLRSILKEQTKTAACPGYHLSLDARHNQIPEMPWLMYDRDFAVNLVEGAYRAAMLRSGSSTRAPDRQLCSATLHISCLPKKKARMNWAPLSTNDNGQYIHELEQIHDTHSLQFPSELSFTRKQEHTNLYIDQAAEEEINFRLGKNGMCWPTGFANTLYDFQFKRWKINIPVYRQGQNYRMEPLRGVEVNFDKIQELKSNDRNASDVDNHKIYNCLSVSGRLHPSKAQKYLANFLPKKEIPMCSIPEYDEANSAYVLPLLLPSSGFDNDESQILIASPSPAFFFKRIKLPSDADPDIIHKNFIDTKSPTSFRIDQVDVPSDITLRVVGYDSHDQIIVWDIREQDLLMAALTKTHKVTGKKLSQVKNVKGIAAVSHNFGEKVFVMTYNREDYMTSLKPMSDATNKAASGSVPCTTDVESSLSALESKIRLSTDVDLHSNVSSSSSQKSKRKSRKNPRRKNTDGTTNEMGQTQSQEKWHIIVYDLEDPSQPSAGVNLDTKRTVERAW